MGTEASGREEGGTRHGPRLEVGAPFGFGRRGIPIDGTDRCETDDPSHQSPLDKTKLARSHGAKH